MESSRLNWYAGLLALALFGMLVADLLTYRSVAAARAAGAGKVGAGWLEAFGTTGWVRPLALGVSYLFTVWHATLLGVLLAGLALTVLPRFLKAYFTRTGWGGSLLGALFALPQPFCSCCASVISPSLVRRGASKHFALAFVVGSPALNLTGLVLAALLLPGPYALLRVLAGIVLAVPVTYAVAWLADRWVDQTDRPVSPWRMWLTGWLSRYCRVFHVEELLEGRRSESPSDLVKAWSNICLRIGLLLVPTLFLLSVVTAAILQVLPQAFGNNVPGVAIAATTGTLMMISTWSELPVAQQMLSAGLSGPAAAMLVVLPPVSLPCLLLLGGALGRLRIAALLGLSVAAIGFVAGVALL